MMIKLNFAAQTSELNVVDGLTVGSLLGNTAYQQVFRFAGNETVKVNGVQLAAHDEIPAGSTVTLETAAQAKA